MEKAKPAKDAYQRYLPHFQGLGGPVFVTFRTRDPLRLPEAIRSAVLNHCLHDQGVKLQMHGAVVMPDHVHLIFTPLCDKEENPYGLAEIMTGIKGASGRSVNRFLGREGPVWQDESFDHVLRSDESAQDKVDYVCENPWRKKLVKSGQEYPWLWREWIEGEKQPTGNPEL